MAKVNIVRKLIHIKKKSKTVVSGNNNKLLKNVQQNRFFFAFAFALVNNLCYKCHPVIKIGKTLLLIIGNKRLEEKLNR